MKPTLYSTLSTTPKIAAVDQRPLPKRNWRAAIFAFGILGVLAYLLHRSKRNSSSTMTTVFAEAGASAKYIQQPLMEALESKLHGKIYYPWMKEFEEARSTWNKAVPRPLAVIEVADEYDIVETIKFMKAFPKVELRIKGGGHNYAGYSVPRAGVVLSLKRINHVEILDLSKGFVRIGGGALTSDVLEKLAETNQWNVVTGMSPTVGMGGFVQGGGYGYLARKHGLAIDTVKSFRVVLHSGEVVTANENSYSDLFWALRGGGGGNFGVVVEMVLQAYRGQDKQLIGSGVIPLAELGEFFATVSENAEKLPPEFALYLEGGMGDLNMMVFLSWVGENDDSLAKGQDFLESFVKPVLFRQFNTSVQYSQQSLVNYTASQNPGENYYISGYSGLLSARKSTRDNWNMIASRLTKLLSDEPFTLLDIELWGGAIKKRRPEATAFAHRDALFSVGYILAVPRTTDYAMKRFTQAVLAGADAFQDFRPLVEGTYVNYQSGGLSAEDALNLYYGTNLARLMKVKRKYDPTNRFHFDQSIPVAQ